MSLILLHGGSTAASQTLWEQSSQSHTVGAQQPDTHSGSTAARHTWKTDFFHHMADSLGSSKSQSWCQLFLHVMSEALQIDVTHAPTNILEFMGPTKQGCFVKFTVPI